MKKFLRTLGLVLALTLIATSLIGCSSEKKVNTGGKFTYWVSLPAATSQTLTSFNELLMYQEMSKITGTEVEFIHPSTGSTGTEAFQILLSSGDYPDMMEYNWSTYTGGPQQAIDDGVIIALNDYMEDYAPNYYNYMEGEKGKEKGYIYKAATVSNSGNYYGFKGLNVGEYRGYAGLYVRKDLLDKWGLDIPETIDDWTNVFKTAKENGIKYPLTGNSTLFSLSGTNTFATAWKVGMAFYVDNGKVKYGPFQKEYKDYLKKMAEWVKEGYVDIDYITNDTVSVEGNMTNGTSIASFGYVGSALGKLLPAMAQKDPNYNLAACPFPVMKKGETPLFQPVQAEATDPSIAISVQCGIDNEDRYKEAIKWCDYLYSDEGILLKAFGIEGDTYTVEKDDNGDEHYVYTDKIMDHEAIGAHSVEAALYHFMRPANAPGFNQHPDYLDGFYPYQQQKDAIRKWNEHVEIAKNYVMPPVSLTAEEATETANIRAAARNNLDAAISNIILGKASLDSYDSAVKAAKKAGYDRFIEIQQDAYDRYIGVISKNK